MIVVICGAIVAIISVIVGLWKYFGRKNAYKRQVANEAQREYEDALKSGDISRINAAMGRINRMQ